tara:strand:+ start:1101 stop:1406 length:306 start_codon:yes stop_codon:yes gene_type:complete
MNYFDRHECMSAETRDLIGMCKSQLITVFASKTSETKTIYFGSVSNMLAGLYDGYDYVDAIKNDDEMLLIQKQNPLLFWAIKQVLKEVETYPKTDKNLATY